MSATYLNEAGRALMLLWKPAFEYTLRVPRALGGGAHERRGPRRRSGRRRVAGRATRRRGLSGVRFLVWLLVLVACGSALGYGFATLFLFPSVPPPDDLVEVPGLRGLALNTARARVIEAGLDLEPVEAVRHPELDSSLVVGQAPLPGQMARRGQPVRLTVSLGPRLEAVPDVVALRGDRAQGVIEATGFLVAVDSVDAEQPEGVVVETDPLAGTVLRIPGVVRLVLSRGPPSVPMPFLLGVPQRRALDTLEILGIGEVVLDTVFGSGREEALVVEQDPPADSLVTRGDTVRLSVDAPERR